MKKTYTSFILYYFFFLTQTVFSQTGWFQQTTGTNLNINCIHFLNSNTGIAGGDLGIILKTTNGGANWSVLSTSVFEPVTSVFVSTANIFLAGTNTKILRSVNGGASWDTTGIGGKKMSFINSSTGYTISGYKTTNAGGGWLFSGLLITNDVVHTVFFTNLNTGFGGATEYLPGITSYMGILKKTVNAGVGWDYVYNSSPDASYCKIYDIYFPDNTNGFALEYYSTSSEYLLLRTFDGGSNWSELTLPVKMNSVRFVNYNNGWMCGINGRILYSTNAGTNWMNLYSPVTSELNHIYMVTADTGYIAGSSGKILKTTNGGITGIKPGAGDIPQSFSLSQNYPNPFNPVTKINYKLPASNFVKLGVYDMLGREIELLVNKNQQAGSYEAVWDASNYPSGVYYYRLTAGEYSQTKKMILIK